MATYWQWKSKHPENKPLYYVCGSEYSLVQEVKDSLIQQWRNVETWRLDAKQMKWSTIESQLLLSRPGINHLVLDNAHLLKPASWELIERLAQAIVSTASTTQLLTVITNEENPDTASSRFRPFVEKGRYVECKQLTEDGLKKYCMTDYCLTEEAADELIELCSSNFTKINNELEKLSLLGLNPVTPDTVRKFVVFSAEDLLVNHLLRRNMELAFRTLHVLKESDCPRVLSILASKLMFFRIAYSKDAPGIGAHKLAAAVGVQAWQLLEFFKIKRFWDAAMMDSKLQLITELERIYHSQRGNVLYFLVKWW